MCMRVKETMDPGATHSPTTAAVAPMESSWGGGNGRATTVLYRLTLGLHMACPGRRLDASQTNPNHACTAPPPSTSMIVRPTWTGLRFRQWDAVNLMTIRFKHYYNRPSGRTGCIYCIRCIFINNIMWGCHRILRTTTLYICNRIVLWMSCICLTHLHFSWLDRILLFASFQQR